MPVSTSLPLRVARAALVPTACLAAVVAGPAAVASPSNDADVTDDVNGIVFSSVQVGDRTFIGGDFTTSGGEQHLNAAAIRADGTTDPDWVPAVNGRVYAMAASEDGSTLYLGGEFTTVDGAARARLAAVDATTGALITGWKANAPGEVSALAVSGDRLYVGGLFKKIDGAAIPRLAAVSASGGVVDASFAPRPEAKVNSLVVSPDGQRLYAGGRFTTVAGVNRPGIAELDAMSGAATTFAPTGGGSVRAVTLTPDGSRLFFSTLSNQTWAYDPALSNSPVSGSSRPGATSRRWTPRRPSCTSEATSARSSASPSTTTGPGSPRWRSPPARRPTSGSCSTASSVCGR